jgi:hypothetical protein
VSVINDHTVILVFFLFLSFFFLCFVVIIVILCFLILVFLFRVIWCACLALTLMTKPCPRRNGCQRWTQTENVGRNVTSIAQQKTIFVIAAMTPRTKDIVHCIRRVLVLTGDHRARNHLHKRNSTHGTSGGAWTAAAE